MGKSGVFVWFEFDSPLRFISLDYVNTAWPANLVKPSKTLILTMKSYVDKH